MLLCRGCEAQSKSYVRVILLGTQVNNSQHVPSVLCAKYCAQRFPCIIQFNPHNNPRREELLFSLYKTNHHHQQNEAQRS